MYCRNCGKEVQPQAAPTVFIEYHFFYYTIRIKKNICVSCGTPLRKGIKYCHNCGAETNPNAEICIKCGVRLAKSKIVAGILGIFLGGFGIHRFYLGYTGIGIIQIIVTIVTCGIGYLWGFIEGILILTGNINKDAQGNDLVD